MGEITEMVLEGILCQVCTGVMDDDAEPGYPRTCPECLEPVWGKPDPKVGSKWKYDNSTAIFEVICLTDIHSKIAGVVTRNTDSGLYFYTHMKNWPKGRKEIK